MYAYVYIYVYMYKYMRGVETRTRKWSQDINTVQVDRVFCERDNNAHGLADFEGSCNLLF